VRGFKEIIMLKKGLLCLPSILLIVVFITAWAVFVNYNVLAESSPIHFKHITLDDGLSQSSIFCIIQDSKGFLWFGTQDGLNKYDGYRFTIYKNDPDDSDSISSNLIQALYEDSEGMIWVGTQGGGLNRFDPGTETFERYPVNPGTPGHLNNPFITSILQDKNGNIWIGTQGGGINILENQNNSNNKNDSPRHDRFIRTGFVQTDPASLSHNTVIRLYMDSKGVIWAGTAYGLNRFNPESSSFTRYYHIEGNPDSLSHNAVTAFCESRTGNFWIGTVDGLNLMDRKTGKFKSYRNTPGRTNSLSGNNITSIYEDLSGVLWVSTRQNGLNRFDKRTESFTRYTMVASDPNSLNSNSIFCIFEDHTRILWVGTEGSGLNKFTREDKFNHYRANPNVSNSLSHNFIYALYSDIKGNTWIGTNGGGLNKFDPLNEVYTHFRHDDNDPSSISSDFVRSLWEDRNGTLWVGTSTAGLDRFDCRTETFSHYPPNPGNPNAIPVNFIRTLYEDRSGVLWIGTQGGGLTRYNRETDNFTSYRTAFRNPDTISDNSVSSICDSNKEPGILWVATLNNGLNRFDPKTGTFKRFTPNPGVPGSLTSPTVQCVYEDKSGTVWAASYGGGLNKLILNPDGSHYFKHYTEKHGLANNATYGLLEDDDGCLWISTNKGLSHFDPKTETFKNYNVKDGLQGNEFNGGAYFKNGNGEMFFGGLNGYNCFFPFKIGKNPHKPPIVITDFLLFNKPTRISRGTGSSPSPLQRHITWTDSLCLSYKQNVFSFEFAALDFTVPGNNKYAYKMEGFDEAWIETDASRRFASYTNLSHGRYVFRVKGSNNDGIWNETGASVIIDIRPPYWKTWWFQAILVLMIATLVLWLYRKRLRNVRIKAELQTAHDAQMSIMPQLDPEIEGFDISGVCVPANEVGGDFFDYLWMNLERTKFGIAIGDVSGKAMKSAMTAVMTSGMIYLEADEAVSVKEIMRRVNRPLYFKTEKKVFTALCLASFNIGSSDITFSNAGLSTPLLISGGNVSRLEGKGNKLPLGVKQDTVYLEKKQALKPGDVIVFFTDGIPESKNNRSEFYGNHRLESLLDRLDISNLTAGEIKTQIINDVKRFSQGAPQHDDMTVVVVKLLQ
jgi:ligand-binding sensor domain-containing protein